MSNWGTKYALKLKHLGVKFIWPENPSREIHINREGGDTYIHGNVHFDEGEGPGGEGGGSVTKEYVDEAVAGNTVGAGRRFSGVNVMPSSSNYFSTDSAQPGSVKKIYMHPDFLASYIEGPGKRFKRGGWIDIHDADGADGPNTTLGMYFVYSLTKDSNGNPYFSVHGMSTVNRNLIVGTNYGMSFACSFNS